MIQIKIRFVATSSVATRVYLSLHPTISPSSVLYNLEKREDRDIEKLINFFTNFILKTMNKDNVRKYQ